MHKFKWLKYCYKILPPARLETMFQVILLLKYKINKTQKITEQFYVIIIKKVKLVMCISKAKSYY